MIPKFKKNDPFSFHVWKALNKQELYNKFIQLKTSEFLDFCIAEFEQFVKQEQYGAIDGGKNENRKRKNSFGWNNKRDNAVS